MRIRVADAGTAVELAAALVRADVERRLAERRGVKASLEVPFEVPPVVCEWLGLGSLTLAEDAPGLAVAFPLETEAWPFLSGAQASLVVWLGAARDSLGIRSLGVNPGAEYVFFTLRSGRTVVLERERLAEQLTELDDTALALRRVRVAGAELETPTLSDATRIRGFALGEELVGLTALAPFTTSVPIVAAENVCVIGGQAPQREEERADVEEVLDREGWLASPSRWAPLRDASRSEPGAVYRCWLMGGGQSLQSVRESLLRLEAAPADASLAVPNQFEALYAGAKYGDVLPHAMALLEARGVVGAWKAWLEPLAPEMSWKGG